MTFENFMYTAFTGLGTFITGTTYVLINRGFFDNILNPNKNRKNWTFKKADIVYLLSYKIFRILLKSKMITLDKHYNTSNKSNNAKAFLFALKIKYFVINKELQLFLSTLEVAKEYTKDELTSNVLAFITLLNDKIEKKWKEAGFPQLAIEKFNRWNAIHIEMLIDGVEGGMDDSENALESMREFLSCFKFIILSTNQDSKKVFSNIPAYYNGDVSPVLTDEVLNTISNFLLYGLT